MDEKEIAKSYAYHSGGFKFDRTKFANFIGDFSELAQEFSRADIEKAVKNNLDVVAAELNPLVDSNDVDTVLVTANEDIRKFLRVAHNKQLTEVLELLSRFPFSRAASKGRLRTALRAIYADEMASFGNDSLGPSNPTDTDTVSNLSPDAAPDSFDADKPADPVESADYDTTEITEEASLDPKLEEDVVFTLESYLQKDVFNSKLIPSVKVVEAKPLKGTNSYVVDVEMASQDGKTKAYATLVIYNGKIVLPAELEDENHSTIGKFSQEAFQSIFSIESGGGTPKNDNDYSSLMDDLAGSKDYIAASKVIEKIIAKFGADVGRGALESYMRIKKNAGKPPQKDFSVSRLDVKIEDTDNPSEDYVGSLAEKEEETFLDEISKKLKKEDQ